MNKSFDDALNEHKSNIAFCEGDMVRKLMLDIDSNSSDYEYYFQKGQQSKQSEIDDLKAQLKAAHESRADFVEYHRTLENA